MKSSIFKYSFLCYALISLGLLWLYALSLRANGLYEKVTQHTSEWFSSHLLLLLGAILIFPTTMLLSAYLKEEYRLKEQYRFSINIAMVLTLAGAVALVCQYLLDIYIIYLFEDKTSSMSYEVLDKIQDVGFVRFLCYDMVAGWLVGQTLFAVILFKTKKYPRWAMRLLFVGLLMLVIGANLHELMERLSYLLFSLALLPLFKESSNPIKANQKKMD